jgi:hypothetical protein
VVPDMVLWLTRHRRLASLLFSIILAIIFTIPYIGKDLLPIGHDTFFHVSRIDGLANAIKDGQYLPAIYPYKNSGFGYASPLFYCDLLLYPFALLDLAGVPISICYKLVIFTWTVLTSYSVSCCISRISGSFQAGWLASTAVIFANYRITDVYVRGALGEVQAFIFLPMLIEGLYIILYEGKTKQWFLLTLGLTGLLMSHNLTFVFSAVLTVIIILCAWKRWTKKMILSLLTGIGMAFLMTVFFSLPMEEQLYSNRFYLNYYAETSDLSSGSLPLWKYFANQTVFGMSSNSLPHDQQMLLNVGWFLTFAPLSWLFVRKKENKPYVTLCMILGYIAILLPSSLLPWKDLTFLQVMQFPWRFLEFGTVLLSVPASIGITSLLKQKRPLTLLVICALSVEGIYHVAPVFTETFGMTSDMTWSDVTEGALCDPYYSATYMRVELAGGDYLPITSPDYRTLLPVIMDKDYESLSIPYEKDSTAITFTLDEEDTEQTIVLPLTWYKGYTLYHLENGEWTEVSCGQDDHGLVSFYASEAGEYRCVYESTLLRNVCIGVSLVSWAAFLFLWKRSKIKA